MFKVKKIVKDYSLVKVCNPSIIGSETIDVFVSNIGIEGGLTVIFEKNTKRGILIFGYTELGEWIEYLQVGNKKIISHLDSDEVIDELIKEYQII